ncbi:MAG: antitoxin component YwqK of YwqJK toxin-antitoxin module [Clostridium sp.]|jgi:antitoxin component YwqK of YwqJK toxin-antitoxin module
MKKYSFFICLLFLSLCSFICNNSNGGNTTETKNQSDSTNVITTALDSPSTKPSEPKETFVFPENFCFDWSFGEEMGVYLTLFTDCDPIDNVFHLVETHSGSYSIVLEGLSFDYEDSEGRSQSSFKMIFYYLNGQKSVEMEVKDRRRYGNYVIYDEQGEILIHRDYSNRDSIISYKEKDSYRWTFDYDSVLTAWTLDLPENDIKDTNGDNPTITLTCLNGDFEQYEYGWDEEELLLVNGALFSGTIEGYDPDVLGYDFGIEFKDGLVHGEFYWRDPQHEEDVLFHALYEKGILIDTIAYYEGD